jgi:ribosomal protein S8
MESRMIKRLAKMYNLLSDREIIKVKDLLGLGFSSSIVYKIITFLKSEGIISEVESGYKVDWNKLRRYLEELIK